MFNSILEREVGLWEIKISNIIILTAFRKLRPKKDCISACIMPNFLKHITKIL